MLYGAHKFDTKTAFSTDAGTTVLPTPVLTTTKRKTT